MNVKQVERQRVDQQIRHSAKRGTSKQLDNEQAFSKQTDERTIREVKQIKTNRAYLMP